MQDKFRICISSPPDRNKLVAEIFFNEFQFAEINQDNSILEIEFYPLPNGKPWRIDFSSAMNALNAAKQKLIGYEM